MPKLLSAFEKREHIIHKIIGYGMISTLIDIPHGQFTSFISDLLAKQCAQNKLTRPVSEYFTSLTDITEQSIQQLEYKNQLRLLQLINTSPKIAATIVEVGQNGNVDKLKSFLVFWRALSRHLLKYKWAYYNYLGPALDKKRVISDLVPLLNKNTDASAELMKLAVKKRNTIQVRGQLERELKFSVSENQLFQALRDTIFMKMYRRDSMTYSFFVFEPLLRELARRINIPYRQAHFIAPWEYRAIANGDKKILSELSSRESYSLVSGIGKKRQVLSGEKAKKFLARYFCEEKIEQITELKGQIACLGMARGKVRIINLASEMSKMEDDDILVSIATIPDIVPAMKKAAAIVTDIGGITSHAAIVSRELGVPCVIGTKIATKILKDGDFVEVDANSGVVRKITT